MNGLCLSDLSKTHAMSSNNRGTTVLSNLYFYSHVIIKLQLLHIIFKLCWPISACQNCIPAAEDQGPAAEDQGSFYFA